MKAATSIATTSSQSPHLASKIRKGRWTAREAKIRAGDKLYKEIARLNLGGPSEDRESTYAVMIGEMPKQEEEEDLYSLLNRFIDFSEAAPTRSLPSKNDAVSVPAPTVSIPSPSAPVSESVDHKITASVVPPSSSRRMEMDMELGMSLDDILILLA